MTDSSNDQPIDPTEPAFGAHQQVPSPCNPPDFQESICGLSASLGEEIDKLVGELQSRWHRGDRATLESLGAGFEQIVPNEEQLLDLIYHEVLIREEYGETPHVEEYLVRFPQHADRLQRLFAVHGAIDDDWEEDLSRGSDDGDSVPSHQERQTPSSTDLSRADEQRPAKWPRKSRNGRTIIPPPGYELLEEIGRGGIAVVFRARQQILNRVVALKMLLAGSIASKEVLQRLQQEAFVVAQLQHAGIVQIFEVGQHQTSPYLSLEYVAGGTLHEWLDGNPLPPLQSASIVEQLALTIQFAHERGIVHRDLKPSNVLLVERPARVQLNETVPMNESRWAGHSHSTILTKISDFGLARILGSRSDLTATGQVLGTPSYMAPEQTDSSCEASPVQDVYSLGAILYELLTGRPPFRGATLFETLEQVRSNEPVAPRQLQPRVPRDLETICLKCLEKSPSRRYATALALANDLRALQQGDSITARPAGQMERTWKMVVRNPTVSSLVALAVFAALAGVGGIWQEARRANRSEVAAKHDRDTANISRIVANRERDNAEAQRKRAIQQTQEAERQTQRADEQLEIAKAARVHSQELQLAAEANLDQALNAIDSLARFGAELKQQPRQQSISQRIVDETLSLYKRLEAEHGKNPRLRLQLAATLTRAGEIRSMLRENDKADELLRRAASILEQELIDDPSDIQLLGLLASATWERGNLFRSTQRPKEALDAYHRSIVARDAVLAIRPDDHVQLVGKANTLVNACVALRQLNRQAETLPLYEEAILILRGVVKQMPHVIDASSELSLALHEYSQMLRISRRTDDARLAFQEAFDLRKRLHQQEPNKIGNRVLLARLNCSQGAFDREKGNLSDSISQFRQAISLSSELVDAYANVYDYHHELHSALIHQIEVCLLAGNADVGKSAWRDLAVRLQTARTMFPDDKKVASRVAYWLPGWADELWEDGQQSDARRLYQLAVETALWLYAASLPAPAETEALLANNAAWTMVTSIDDEKRDLPRAKELAQRAVSLSPETAAYLHTLGTVLLRLREPAEAKDVLVRAITLEKQAVNRKLFAQVTPLLRELPRGNAEAAREVIARTLESGKPKNNDLQILNATLLVALSMLNEQPPTDLIVDPTPGFSIDGPLLRRLNEEARTLAVPQSDK